MPGRVAGIAATGQGGSGDINRWRHAASGGVRRHLPTVALRHVAPSVFTSAFVTTRLNVVVQAAASDLVQFAHMFL